MNKKNIFSIAVAVMLPLTFINGLFFLLISALKGGMAFNGKIVRGQYYLGEGEIFTEVSSAFYYFNFWHGITVVAMMLFTFGLFGVDNFLQKKSSTKYQFDPLKSKNYRIMTLVLCIIFAIAVTLLPFVVQFTRLF